MATSAILELVEHIYEAALSPRSDAEWDDLLLAFERQIPGGRAVLFLEDAHAAKVDLFLAPNYDPGSVRSYAERYCATNPWTAAMSLRPQGSIHSAEMLVPETRLVDTEFYNDWLRPQGLHSGGGCTILKEAGRMMVLTFLKPPGLVSVTAREFTLMRRLMPHLQRAAQLRRQFGEVEMTARWATNALDRLSVGLILLEAPKRIVFVNRVAQELLKRTRRISLDVRYGIRFADSRAAARFSRLVRCADFSFSPPDRADVSALEDISAGGAMKIVGDEDEPTLSILVAPFNPTRDRRGAGAPTVTVLLAAQGDHLTDRARVLAELYDLTRAEAAVLTRIVAGESAQEIAARQAVGVVTVRTHIQRLLAKTGTRRQADLVARVMADTGGFVWMH